MRVDSHMHTALCRHAVGEPIEYAIAAADKGIDLITFTCHIPMSWEAFGQEAVSMKKEDLQDDKMRIDSYFRHLKQGVLSGRYDSISHPHVIRTYGVVEDFNPEEHEEVICGFLQTVYEEDICMEVNTSGLIKGDFEVHPDPLILEWASEIGVKLTIGSNSHSPESVGQFFDTIQPTLRSKGFTYLHYFRSRQRHRIDMPDGIR